MTDRKNRERRAQEWKMNWLEKQGDHPRPDPSTLLGVTELAERYGVQPNTVAVWAIRHPSFPAPLLRVGGRVRVWWAPDVDEWVASR